MVALLMVSRVPYPHMVNQVFRGQRSSPIVGGGLYLVAVMVDPEYSVPIICCAFVFYGPVALGLGSSSCERRRQEESLF